MLGLTDSTFLDLTEPEKSIGTCSGPACVRGAEWEGEGERGWGDFDAEVGIILLLFPPFSFFTLLSLLSLGLPNKKLNILDASTIRCDLFQIPDRSSSLKKSVNINRFIGSIDDHRILGIVRVL